MLFALRTGGADLSAAARNWPKTALTEAKLSYPRTRLSYLVAGGIRQVQASPIGEVPGL